MTTDRWSTCQCGGWFINRTPAASAGYEWFSCDKCGRRRQICTCNGNGYSSIGSGERVTCEVLGHNRT